jgi:hypothetical protein
MPGSIRRVQVAGRAGRRGRSARRIGPAGRALAPSGPNVDRARWWLDEVVAVLRDAFA